MTDGGLYARTAANNLIRATHTPEQQRAHDSGRCEVCQPAASDHVRCSRCGARCSNDVPVELVVRAFVECPECVAAQPEPEVHVTLTRGGVVTADGFGKVLDPGDTYTTSAPADLTIQ